MNGIAQRSVAKNTQPRTHNKSAHGAERWAREVLNLRPHAYQPGEDDGVVRHPPRTSLTDGAICRGCGLVLPYFAGINGQHNGQRTRAPYSDRRLWRTHFENAHQRERGRRGENAPAKTKTSGVAVRAPFPSIARNTATESSKP